MKTGMTLSALNTEVQRQAGAKIDYLINTAESLRLVPMKDFDKGVALVSLDNTLGAAAQLQRWELTSNAHDQIAAWIEIPRKYYDRLLIDHPDMLMDNVNKLFEREPGTRMVRTLDGKCRAFMSDRYRRLDNDQILGAVLPQILAKDGTGARAHEVIRSVITDSQMDLTVVFTDPALAQNLGQTAKGETDIVFPGFRVGNSEVGRGGVRTKGFFYRSYCRNGCVFALPGSEVEFSRNHSGSKLSADMERLVITDETRAADDRALMLQLRDVIASMGTAAVSQAMGDALRAAKGGLRIQHVQAGIETLAKHVGLLDSERDMMLKNLIEEADLSRFGALNAITAIANEEATSDDRALELEEIGGSLITMNQAQWDRIARAQKVPVAA